MKAIVPYVVYVTMESAHEIDAADVAQAQEYMQRYFQVIREENIQNDGDEDLLLCGFDVQLGAPIKLCEMDPVDSSNLRLVGHLEQAEVLDIEFRDGGLYRYYGFPTSLHEEFLKAPSRGKFFHQRIKGKYPFKKLNPGAIFDAYLED
jgi:hypothetical protein